MLQESKKLKRKDKFLVPLDTDTYFCHAENPKIDWQWDPK